VEISAEGNKFRSNCCNKKKINIEFSYISDKITEMQDQQLQLSFLMQRIERMCSAKNSDSSSASDSG